MENDNRFFLPKGWVWSMIENCVEILDNQRVAVNADERKKRISGKPTFQLYPYYGSTGQVGWIDDYLFKEELILLGEDGAPFFKPTKNKAYIIKGKSWVNNHAHVLKAISGITSNSFLCHYLNIFDYHGYVTGTTRHKLNQSPMRQISIPIPPLPEQHRIVDKIEELFTKLDAGVEALKKVRAELKRYRQAVLKYAFEGKLSEEWRKENKGKIASASVLLMRIKEGREKGTRGKSYRLSLRGSKMAEEILKEEISSLRSVQALPSPSALNDDLSTLPEGWCWALLPELGELSRGKSKHRPRDDNRLFGGEYPFIQTGDIKNSDGLIKSYTQTYNEFGLKQSRLWPVNTVCITIAANIADTAVLGVSACFPDSVVGFIADNKICEVKYVHFFLKTVKNKLESCAPATAQKNINLETLKNVVVPIPPLPEQHKIVEEIERRISVADEGEKVVVQSLKQAKRLRQSILKRAFEGKLVPQDPTDEPAERLLERIKTEKVRLELIKKDSLKTRKGKLPKDFIDKKV